MRFGNITQTIWKRSVYEQLSSVQGKVLIPPSAGERCGSMEILLGNVVIHGQASASGNAPSIGAFAAVKGMNDLATHGATPSGLSVQILLHSSNEEEYLKELIKGLEQVCSIAKVQLHCVSAEVNPAVVRPIVLVTVYGQAKKGDVMGAEGGTFGQDIILCGYAGLEGMLCMIEEEYEQLCTRFTSSFLKQAQAMPESLLVLEGIYRAKRVGVTAMLQVGGGGVLGALWELAEASCMGMELELSNIPIRQETIEICEYYKLNPYQMTSTGAILMAAHNGDELIRVLGEVGIPASKLGVFTNEKGRILRRGQEVRYLDKPAQDELMHWWAEKVR